MADKHVETGRAVYARFRKGVKTKWHCHTGEQMLYVTEGKGFVEFEGRPDIPIGVGDQFYVPAGVWHRLRFRRADAGSPGHNYR